MTDDDDRIWCHKVEEVTEEEALAAKIEAITKKIAAEIKPLIPLVDNRDLKINAVLVKAREQARREIS